MSSPTIRIRLAKQPPLYLLVAVVVASLCPLLIQLWGTPAVASLQRLPALAATPQALQPLRMPAFAEEPAAEAAVVVPVDDEAEAVVADPELEAEPKELDAVIILDEPAASAPRQAAAPARAKPPGAEAEVRTREAPAPTAAQRAKAACARKDKASARTAYRSLPVGDSRRREIRRACREQGVWVL